jgi:triosephosphate isomerase
MIASCNAKYVVLGHSERRVNFKESNEILKAKVGQAFRNDLKVIFCCGESLSQRESGVHFDWIKAQISESLFHLSSEEFKNIVVAYEPIWAIGTGVTASTDQAQEMHAFIRNILVEQYGNEVALSTSILYGGSCKPSNAKELFASQDIDGGLIGGASLNSDDFIAITQSF